MFKNHKCSIQYHEKKMETIYQISGTLKIYYGNEIDSLREIILTPNEYFTIKPFVIHRMEALEDSVYLESSTPELEDTVRLQDDYGRT
jgi:uncharacterized RmlC-like cupin family protein